MQVSSPHRPPSLPTGPWLWARRNLFSSPANVAVTLICAALIAAIGAAMVD